MTDELMTPEGYEALQRRVVSLRAELTALRSEKHEAAEIGGNVWHDNAAFESLELQERRIMRSLGRALDRLRRATVVDSAVKSTETIGVGSVVTLETEDGARWTLRLLGSEEADPAAGVISYMSPIGQALMGRRVGERPGYRVRGRERFAHVLEIQ